MDILEQAVRIEETVPVIEAVIQQVTQTFLLSQVPDQLVQAGDVPDTRDQQSRTIFLREKGRRRASSKLGRVL